MNEIHTVVVIVGGGPVVVPPHLYVAQSLVIAADSGVDAALAAGLTPSLVVGDLDSISEQGLAWARANDVAIEQHPPAKDDTDTALALAIAAAEPGRHLVLLAPAGTVRLDHLLGTLAALGDARLAGCASVTAWVGDTVVHVLHPGSAVSLHLAKGTTFSLHALHGPCQGVALSGAQWPLDDAELASASTRGISNVTTSSPVHASVRTGVLTLIIPEDAT